MDGISIMIIAYLAAYPVFAGLKAWAAWQRRELRFRNERTRLEWLDVFGSGIVFDWRTLLWFYLLDQSL